ncbi:hypothetical protein [Paenibacillus glycanilyticus]|uniref:Uncharacterized protein n=1 Tax=Paenibacillus glycanilyticus TaxID=126569 RepID=A0ABQ6GJ63_9BACL|nr:hypothetical protein [Paenibacillus glycanilyticus]GLX69341.1 hypothetical protein MU1_36860 [Paenibacillus glycanilyticus]
MPRTINLFIGFIVGVILMILPQPHIFIISDVLDAITGGDIIDTPLHKIVGTIGFVLVCVFGYKLVTSILKEN